jgi:hypothetical protein
MTRVSTLYILWAGLSLAAMALFAEGFRGAPPPPSAGGSPAFEAFPAPASPNASLAPSTIVRKNRVPQPEPPPPSPPEPGPPPRIEFDRDTVDLGLVLQGTESPFAFAFRNRGDGVLRIL